MQSVLIADDHPIVRKGLIEILYEANAHIRVGEASDGGQALESALHQHWDVIILDISMPVLTGLQVLRKIAVAHLAAPVIMLSMHNTREYILAALKAGAAGYVSKEDAHGELLAAIQCVLAGQTYLSTSLRHLLKDSAVAKQALSVDSS